MLKKSAWQNIRTNSYLEFDINNINTGALMEMSSTNSTIVATSYIPIILILELMMLNIKYI